MRKVLAQRAHCAHRLGPPNTWGGEKGGCAFKEPKSPVLWGLQLGALSPRLARRPWDRVGVFVPLHFTRASVLQAEGATDPTRTDTVTVKARRLHAGPARALLPEH